MRGEKGFALVLTLVVTALMVAAAVELIHQVYVDTSLNRSFRDGQQASILAESGAEGGKKLLALLLAKHPGYTSLADQWATPFTLDDEVGRIEITTSDESGKINLNALVQGTSVLRDDNLVLGVLKRLGKQLDIPDSAWNALADWLDSDDLPLSGGAETSYYKTLSPPYAARNGSLATVNELSLIKGFTPEMVNRLRPFVTVYPMVAPSGSLKVNVNTAPKEVLMALDSRIDARTAERIIDTRRVTPLKNLADIGGDPQLPMALTKVASPNSTVFRITTRGFVKDAARTVETVVNMDGTPQILSWQEY